MKEDSHKRMETDMCNFFQNKKNNMNISENKLKMINEDEYKHLNKTKSREESFKVKHSKS